MFLDEPASGLDPVAAHEVRGMIAGLRDRGVTVFLTTHRLEEAERLCDRAAIMSTSLRTIGRPDDLRQELFAASLDVTAAAALPEPGRVFGGLPAVQGWKAAGPPGGGPASYALTVSDVCPTFGLVAALAGGLLAVDCAACLAVARLFHREGLITGARPSRGIPAPAAPQDIQSPGEVTAHRKGELKCRRL
jgi:energy-coupling factor transporter ATP-binding protein EcfA2